MRKRLISVFTIVFILINIFSVCYVANAEETTSNTTSSTRKYLGETVYVGHSEGYSLNEKIEKDNPNFGWELGNFYVSGFTRAIDENTKNSIKFSFTLPHTKDTSVRTPGINLHKSTPFLPYLLLYIKILSIGS